MKTILILIILLTLPVRATWAQIVDGDGIPLDTCTEEEAIAILKAFGDYKSPDTLTHYRQIDTTVDSSGRCDSLTPHYSDRTKPKGGIIFWSGKYYDTTIDTTWHEKIPERGEHFIPIIFINTPGLIGTDTVWVDTTNPNTYLRVTTSGEPLNRFYGMGIENDWKYEITVEMISDGIEKSQSKLFGEIESLKPDSFGIFDSAYYLGKSTIPETGRNPVTPLFNNPRTGE